MQITALHPRIDLGNHCWRMPSSPGWLFGSEKSAMRYAEENTLDPSGLWLEDTRPTLGDVMRQIIDAENDACGHTDPDSRKWNAGPWDEYFSLGYSPDGKLNPKARWPDGYRWVAVYPVHGGSEGIYLHVDLIFQKDRQETRQCIFIGKTCSENREAWEACYASAMRIAWMLHA